MSHLAPTALLSILSLFMGFAQNTTQSDDEKRERALWSAIKEALTSDNGNRYFEENIHLAELPSLRGTVVSATPAIDPDTIVLAMSDSSTAEVTVEVIDGATYPKERKRSRFHGRLEPGDEVRFMGVGSTFTKVPFMLTFDADAEDIQLVLKNK
jgi:hypothetical protein